jgi:CrcB protein
VTAATWAGVVLCGGAGAVARYLVDGIISSSAGRALPYGTFAINISGAFLLGLLTGLAVTGDALTLAGTATLGSYTTFSTWMLETHRLREDGQFAAALINVLAALLVGVGAAALGRYLGARG